MPRFAANLSMLFTEVAFPARFAAAAAAGFQGVEFLFPYDEPPEGIAQRLGEHGLTLALHNTPPGDWAAGERGLAAVPGQEDRFRAGLARALAYAEVLGPRNIHVMAGIARGPEARATYVANLRHACAAAPGQGFVIEPINPRDMPGYHLSRSDDACAVIAEVGAPNLGLQLDLYHTQIVEGDLTRRIEALAPLLGHVQIAGVPEREEPDRGETDLGHLMGVLDRVGYGGWVGCEYRPRGGTHEGLGWLRTFATPARG